jgi:hypothetical protein
VTCRYDRDAEDYLIDGEPCRYDDYGDPTVHCRARLSCSQHIGRGEFSCARCVGRARTNVRQIALLAALMLPVAIGKGVNSEAANLAGPAADPRAERERREAMRRHLDTWETLERITERQHLHALVVMSDDDERHPYNVLTRWQMMLSEDYGHTLPAKMTTAGAADYLERNLHRIAQDPEQDFPLLARELRKCRSHLEAVLGDAEKAEKGQPCPECQTGDVFVRLKREWGHWCESEDCERRHYIDDSGDMWICPRNPKHRWSEKDYRERIADVYDTA